MENLINFENFIMIWYFICFTFYKVSVVRISSRKKSFFFLPFFLLLKIKTPNNNSKQNNFFFFCCKSIFYKPIRQSRLEYDIYVFNIFKHKTFFLSVPIKCEMFSSRFKQGNQTFKSKRNPLVFSTLQKHFKYIYNWMKLPLLGKGLFHVFFIFHRLLPTIRQYIAIDILRSICFIYFSFNSNIICSSFERWEEAYPFLKMSFSHYFRLDAYTSWTLKIQ